MFSIGINSLSPTVSYSVPVSNIWCFLGLLGSLFTTYLYFLTPVVIVALLVSLVNSLSPSSPFT